MKAPRRRWRQPDDVWPTDAQRLPQWGALQDKSKRLSVKLTPPHSWRSNWELTVAYRVGYWRYVHVVHFLRRRREPSNIWIPEHHRVLRANVGRFFIFVSGGRFYVGLTNQRVKRLRVRIPRFVYQATARRVVRRWHS